MENNDSLNEFFESDEFNNLDKHSKDMLRRLFIENDLLKNSLSSEFSGEPGYFVQKLDDRDSNNQIDEFISKYNMSQEINILQDHPMSDKVIEEIWTSEDGLIKMKRYFELTYKNINLLRPESRRIVHNILLDDALNKEDYERAAEIRDSIYLNE
jgi:hypothetical protein